MRNWQEIVSQRLSGLELDSAEKEEVHAELAAHLEESYAVLYEQGLREKDAADLTLQEVADWRDLQRDILAAKRREHPMKQRVQQLWIPGFLTFALSTVFLMTLQKLGFRPHVIGDGPGAILFYVPWLASLLFCGAFGAYLSSRARASREITLLASAFPVLALTAAFLLMFPIDMIVKSIIGSPVDFGIVAAALLRDVIGWLLLPGVALLLGGFLVHLFLRPSSSSQETVVG